VNWEIKRRTQSVDSIGPKTLQTLVAFTVIRTEVRVADNAGRFDEERELDFESAYQSH
jgi:hypothetical protein